MAVNIQADPAVEQPPLNEIEPVSREQLIVTMLMPYIETAIADYYGTHQNYAVGVAPYVTELVSITLPEPKLQHTFEVTLYAKPYAGAQTSVGQDILIFEVSPEGIRLIEYKHEQPDDLR